MVTGIDETGDFRLNSNEISFFVGIHIDQNLDKFTVKEKQFNEWETSIPDVNRSKSGEVKGRLLTDNQLEEFYQEVMMKPPQCHFSVVEYLPSDNSEHLLEKHKRWFIGQIEAVMEDYKNSNRPNWAKRYNEIKAWSKNLSYQEMIKMKCLHNLLAMSFNQAFTYGQLAFLHDKDESNLKGMAFKVDKDFVKGPNVRKFWDEHFHQFWKTLPIEYQPIIFLSENLIKTVIEKYFKIEGDLLMISKSFNENTTFVDSKDSYEVRLADIFGTILHRHHNRGLRCDSIWASLVKIIHLGKDVPIYTRLVFEK